MKLDQCVLNLQKLAEAAHLCEAQVFPGQPLVLGFDGQLVPGGGVVQAGGRLRDGVQVDGLNGASGREDTPGPRGLYRRAGWSGLMDLLVMKRSTSVFTRYLYATSSPAEHKRQHGSEKSAEANGQSRK